VVVVVVVGVVVVVVVVVSGLAPRWAAKQPQERRTRCIRHSVGAGFGAASQPGAGQARSPQQLYLPGGDSV